LAIGIEPETAPQSPKTRKRGEVPKSHFTKGKTAITKIRGRSTCTYGGEGWCAVREEHCGHRGSPYPYELILQCMVPYNREHCDRACERSRCRSLYTWAKLFGPQGYHRLGLEGHRRFSPLLPYRDVPDVLEELNQLFKGLSHTHERTLSGYG